MRNFAFTTLPLFFQRNIPDLFCQFFQMCILNIKSLPLISSQISRFHKFRIHVIGRILCVGQFIQCTFFLYCFPDFLCLFTFCRKKKYRIFLISPSIPLDLIFYDLTSMCMDITESGASCNKQTSQKDNSRFPLFFGHEFKAFVHFCCFFLVSFCQIQPFFSPHRLNRSKVDCQSFS